ncbi:conserved hypothetical protein [Neospora caninum Liverpool]|uniref:Uncharacterized protein n=1 Tax=Neospora caninum (strain Liverpool) TaxID=572307 RepID=F0VEC0_NEOCL|nr:conserved hypothetical protein [Neospora caninum Liverpool]CBZ52064.1 conserved hypothetical protein [Neospora caninum Liverpool]CEL66025.1 TPA: hypothetical protein BN1204_018540 [Neospora caninum Liverpool]|eukprot:XP_003882096.1 conserved hypothetical protein [Neospora caninum Liverpool]
MKLSAVLLFGSLFGFAAASEAENPVDSQEQTLEQQIEEAEQQAEDVEQQVEEDLKQGEAELESLLGTDTAALHELLRKLVDDFSSKFDVNKKDLSEVAKKAMATLGSLTAEELSDTVNSLMASGAGMEELEKVHQLLSSLQSEAGVSGLTDGM